MADIFNEIDEDIRRERLAQLWKRYGPYVVAAGIVMLACIGAWRGYEWWEAKKAAEAGSAFEAASALADEGKHDEAAAAFAKLAAEGTSGYRVLARIREAALQAQHDPSAAVAAYDALAADASLGRTLQDLAAIRAALIRVDSAPYPELQSRLEPLAGPGGAFRHRARTARALRLARGRQCRGEALDRCGHKRSRDAVEHAQPRRGAERAHRDRRQELEHDAERWEPVFGEHRAPSRSRSGRTNVMRRYRCASRIAAALGLALMLGGCETSDMIDKLSDLIPFGQKKPLPGERRQVFPEGVPGVPQGVPPELVKGNQPPPEAAPPPPQAAAPPPVEKPKPKKKAQAKAKPPAQQQPAPDQSAAWTSQPTQPAGAWPTTAQPAPPQPAQPQPQPAWPPAQSAQPQQPAWPAPSQTAGPAR